MGDEGLYVFWFVVLAFVVGGVRFLVRLVRAASADTETAQRQVGQRQMEIRAVVERRLLQLIAEFPAMTDYDIATIMRDELQNAHEQRAEFFQWATPETAGRLRRTLLLQIARDERRRMG